MAQQASVAVRNARLDAIETTISTSAILRIRTGAQPASCATADSGTVLVSISLGSDWMSAASAGVKAKNGTWQGTAGATGDAGHYRIYASDGTTCHWQGSVSATAGGGDMELAQATVGIVSGQVVTVGTYQWTEALS